MTVLLTMLLGVVLSAGVSTTRSAMTLGASRERIGGTLGRASLVQMEFRSTNARFANWDELEARGMRLADDLAVVSSTATQSHWYLRLRDRSSGVTCERIGQLFDPPAKVIAPSCDN